jgi:hypothetical protein
MPVINDLPMTTPSFQPSFWTQDISLLAIAQRELAEDALHYACDVLGCFPYHRASKARARSDRQTLLRHPQGKHVCLVLSVAPAFDNKSAKALRSDFFDAKEQILSECGEIRRAPRTQWTRKGERRMQISSSANLAALRAFLSAVIARE